jgi:acylphosphatase
LIARLCRVSGRVQGVFFRAATRDRADELGVVGYARNLPNGTVEVLACGDELAVRTLCDWLWQGPPAAHVTAVTVEERDLESISPRPTVFSRL